MPAVIKDTKTPDARGIRNTTPSHGNEWVLVHDGTKVIVLQENNSNETSSTHSIETFDDSVQADMRVVELGLIPLP